jgi:hypothetical protein
MGPVKVILSTHEDHAVATKSSLGTGEAFEQWLQIYHG